MPVSLTPPMTIYPNNQTFTEMYRVDRSSGEFSDIENDEAIYGGGKVKKRYEDSMIELETPSRTHHCMEK